MKLKLDSEPSDRVTGFLTVTVSAHTSLCRAAGTNDEGQQMNVLIPTVQEMMQPVLNGMWVDNPADPKYSKQEQTDMAICAALQVLVLAHSRLVRQLSPEAKAKLAVPKDDEELKKGGMVN